MPSGRQDAARLVNVDRLDLVAEKLLECAALLRAVQATSSPALHNATLTLALRSCRDAYNSTRRARTHALVPPYGFTVKGGR